jgi:acyl-CoA synthetase (AMP-forming)/AMP-acid ligase II
VTLYGSVKASLPIFQGRSRGLLPTGSCDRVRPGYRLHITNDVDEELPPKTLGRILLRAYSAGAFFDGYFNNAANTLAAFRNM